MPNYSLRIKKSAGKALSRIAKPDRTRLIAAIDALAGDPQKGKSLKGNLTGLRRIRVGDYRVIYEIQDAELIVLVIQIGHWRTVYR